MKKDLETTLKEKVTPLLEKTMEKTLGITIPKIETDISDRLKNPHITIYVASNTPFQEAKKQFKEEFLKKELQFHLGNVSQLAKSLGLDRRSIHRAIKELDIDIDSVRSHEMSQERYQQDMIQKTIHKTLKQYEDVIRPEKLEEMYEKVPSLSRNIAEFLPHQDLTWKEAEEEFEKQFLKSVLEEQHWNVARTAAILELRTETLHRKIKKLRLKR